MGDPARIRLLGPRRVIGADGADRSLPGHKPWALLASLALASGAVSRRALAERIWPDADDPLGALRWALLQVRRAIEPAWAIEDGADGLRLRALGDGLIDAGRLLDGRLEPDEVDDLVAGPLLDDLSFPDAPDLEHWLMLERRRVESAATGALRWAAATLAATEPDRALGLLARATGIDPYDDLAHEAAVSILAGAGDLARARRYAEQVRDRYRTELGVEPPPTVTRAIAERTGAPEGVTAAATARALLHRADASAAAGAYDAAEEAGRRAVTAATASGDRAIECRALLSLASTLVHAIRGRDHEAEGLLDRALTLAGPLADPRLTGEIEWERGWVAFLDARYGAAEATMRRVIDLAGSDQGLRGRAAMVLGAALSDRCAFAESERTLRAAVADLDAADDRFEAFARSFLARLLLRTGRPDEAREVGRRAVEGARGRGWASLLPWTLVVEGEAALRSGDRSAADILEESYVLAQEVGDPCWLAFGLRGLSLVAREQGRHEDVERLLARAVEHADELPDVYTWARALVATDLAEIRGSSDPALVARARSLAERGPMADLAARLLALGSGATR